jgi:glutamate racemase
VGNWLAEQGVKAITIACNTATVVAAKSLREHTLLPVVAIEPAIKPAVAMTRSGVVGVLATRQTVQSASVARLVELFGADKRVLLQGCPGLVEQVERADLHSPETEALLRQFITPLLEQGADTLVLGCTHYPFLRDTIQRVAGSHIMLVDPAEAVARELSRRLADKDGLSHQTAPGLVKFFSSGDIALAQTVMSHLWDAPLTVHALP